MFDFLERRRCRIMEAKVAELARKYGSKEVWLADYMEGRFPKEGSWPEYVADTSTMSMHEYVRFREGLEGLTGGRISLYSLENDNKGMREVLSVSRKIYGSDA